jgi:hypothetical protein
VIDFDRSEKDHSSRFRVRGVFTQPGSEPEDPPTARMSAASAATGLVHRSKGSSLNHLVGEREYARRERDSNRACGLEIDN